MSCLSSLYQLAKIEQRPFQSNRIGPCRALNQQNGSESIYGYKVNNVKSKNTISVFLLGSFLLYITWIPVSSWKIYFSFVNLNKITENINISWFWYLYRNCVDIFPSDGPEWIHKEWENWRSSIYLENFHLFGEYY